MKLSKLIVALNAIVLVAVIALSGCGDDDDPSPGVNANAGADQTVQLGEIVTLDGSLSSSADGSAITYFWELTSAPTGSSASLSASTTVAPTLAPDVTGTYTISLTVDNGTATASDEVIITVEGGVQPEEIGGTISQDRTLINRIANPDLPDYIASSNVIVDAKLTIEPGVKIIFANDVHMDVDDGALVAQGTSTEHIVFTGVTESVGFWRGIFIFSNDVNNQMNYTEVKFAGSSARGFGLPKAAVGIDNGDQLAFTNSIITHSADYGLFVENGGVLSSFSNNSFSENGGLPLSVSANEVSKLDAASTFSANGNQHVEIKGSALASTNEVTWGDFDDGTPYLVTGNLEIESGLKITAGSTFYFEADLYMESDDAGYIIAQGASGDMVKFLGSAGTAGSWRGIQIFTNDTKTLFDYVEIAHGGSSARGFGLAASNLAIDNGDQAKVTNSIIRDSNDYGIYVEKGASISDFSNNEFSNNGGRPLALDANQIHQIDGASTFNTGNGDNSVEILGSDLEQGATEVTWQALSNSTPYYVSGRTTINSGLVLNPGVNIEVGSDVYIYVDGDGYLSAEGTSTNGISITGKSKAPGAWRGLIFFTNDVRNSLDYVTVSHGGSTDVGFGVSKTNVGVNGGDRLSITNCNLTDSNGYGLFIESGAIVTASGNTYSNNTLGNTN
ncbi:hypothetical protein E1176_16665 [Fulvivirga sp. RKSG066]|uniref:PKD domain-containing protein n=1 Tax=Fulvivirga aurantia TaxID=2529383 RepID=UPI0012BB7F8E|nr:PKD domain-containing protein [Fulvivirga aurantia]MTI22667.1 hypothetical protein [Fulvivirga aurantia]